MTVTWRSFTLAYRISAFQRYTPSNAGKSATVPIR